MVKVVTSICIDAELRDLAKAKGLNLSNFINEMLYSLLLKPEDKVEHKSDDELINSLKDKEKALLAASAELNAIKAKIEERKKKQKKEEKEKGIIHYTPEQARRMAGGEY